jgi:uncharacterized protein (DUF983 family)
MLGNSKGQPLGVEVLTPTPTWHVLPMKIPAFLMLLLMLLSDRHSLLPKGKNKQ